MSDQIWEKRRFRIGIRWRWTEKHRRELLSRPQLIRVVAQREEVSTKFKKLTLDSSEVLYIELTGK
jgi:hypothetical protein